MSSLDALGLPVSGAYIVLFLLLSSISSNLLYMTLVALKRPPRHADPPPLTSCPSVTIQLPIFNELYVVERLIRAACEVDWPKECLEIQVLDDSTDETQFIAARLVRWYAERGYNITHVRRPDRVGYKAGALAEGLRVARGEFIAIFDADFVPPREFLRRTLPYFFYERVGFVQARGGHVNRSYSILTQFQSVIIDAHYFIDQFARNRGGFFMNFNGTAGVWRRTAIIDAGGWEHDTLAEDMDLSYRAQLNGWEAVYLPNLVAYAELPVTISGYRSQQRRWAAGAFACALKLLPRILRAPISIGTKIQAVFHLLGHVSHVALLFMFLLQPLLLYQSQRASQIPLSPAYPPVWMIIAIIPALAPGIYLAVGQWRSSGQPLSRLPFVLGASLLGAGIVLTIVGAVVRVLYRRQLAFERTPKYGISHPSDSWDGKRYGLGLDPLVTLEVLLAGFAAGTMAYAAMVRSWGSLFFAGYFLLGLLFVIGTSCVQVNVPQLPRILASSPTPNREP
ncbi:MAG: glycosyltransferase [Chloroflexi bacterium]|nr:glycosyltransferase [Chloroflexota bacterium]